MPSPFPGMNPYLESHFVWHDFHQTFVTVLRTTLAPLVAPNYFVQVQERVYLHDSKDEDGEFVAIADVEVTRRGGRKPKPRSTTTGTVLAPAKVRFPQLRRRKSGYLEVLDLRSQEVVTVIELLSPSNKYAGDDRESFLAKRRQLLAGRANYVELDFLRGGPRLPLGNLPSCDYYAVVSRPADRPDADIWPITLRNPLPLIPVPLRSNEPDARVDLQAVLHRVYDDAGYRLRIYEWEPEPRLAPADAEWAAGILAAAPKG